MQKLTLCAFKAVTGLRCPGCGLCHSVVALFQGKVGLSLCENPAGVLVVMFVLYWGFKFVLRRPPGVRREFGQVFAAALFTQWVFYLCCQAVENLRCLAP